MSSQFVQRYAILAALIFAAGSLVGCWDKQPKQTGQTNGGGNGGSAYGGDAEPSEPIEPLLEDWEQPAVAILLTGEQHGYLEPCGCSEKQAGGLARRFDLTQQLRERGWDVVGFDLGGTLKRTRRQSELKLDFTRHALDQMQYSGLGLGPEELKLGPERLFQAYSETAAEDDFTLPFVSANVTLFGTREIGTPTQYETAEAGGVKIAATSILGSPYLEDVRAAVGSDPNVIDITDPAAALEEVIPQMQAENPDVMILLSHAEPNESRALAEAFPQFDLVVTAGGPEDPLNEPESVGEAKLLRVGKKGKHVGVIGVYPKSEPRLKFDLVELDRFRFENAPEMAELMRVYQQRLEEASLATTEKPIDHPTGAEFVGAEACRRCHTKAYGIWSKTKHAHAFESLSRGREGMEKTWIDRSHDPECLACHVTGWEPQEVLRFSSGFLGESETPHLAGQQCENCHGPASRHVELEEALLRGGQLSDELVAERKAMQLEKAWAKDNLCIKCHDLDNSPDFNFETYWPKVEHLGKD